MLKKLLIAALFICFSQTLAAKTIVKVGGYPFSPYVDISPQGHYSGLTLDLISALNRIQTEVVFQFVATSTEQRRRAYELNRYDVIFFEDVKWGWQDASLEYLPLNIKDGEVFISLNEPVKQQQYFDSLDAKTLSLIQGYHYKFAEFETSKDKLAEKFKVQFVASNEASIKSILKQRAEIAPVTWSYLKYYQKREPEQYQKLIISNKWDQQYDFGVLIKPESQISIDKIEKWMAELTHTGVYQRLLTTYNLSSH
ncbi:ABC transporter substrate-binding protein [Shewanella maritima]|uniref:ABC transporter substrate-binding protein n=1 Tax=Shewanella maritima TaxID=2520507 RepID=UPI0037356DB7